MKTKMNLLGAGFSALRSWQIIIVLWAAATLAALPAVVVFWSHARRAFAGNAAGEALMANRHPDAGFYMIDFLNHQRGVTVTGSLILLGVLMTLVQQSFLNGGIIELAGTNRRPFLPEFIAACGRHFGRNLKLTFLFIVVVVVVVGMWLGFTAPVGQAIFRDRPPNAPGAGAFQLVSIAVAGLLFLTLKYVFDIARAAGRFDSNLGSWASIGKGFQWFFSAPARVFGVALFWLGAGAAGQMLLLAAEWSIERRSGAAVLGVLLLGQLAIVWRCGARLAAWGSTVRIAEAGHMAEIEKLRIEQERVERERLERERIERERAYQQWLLAPGETVDPYEAVRD